MPVGRMICHVKTMSPSLSEFREILFVLSHPQNDGGRAKVAV